MKRTQVLSAAAALLFVATAAHAQRGQGDRRGHQDQHAQAEPQEQQHRGGGDSRVTESQHSGVERARAEQERASQERATRERENQARAAEEQNQRRAVQQAQELRDRQSRQAQQQEQIERAERAAQLEERERLARASRSYDRDRDDRVGYVYRYNLGGRYHETNQYGVDVLRQALNQGYQQGFRAGLIDRRDGAPADFRRAFDFENGEYGYTGSYVPQSDYSYYFREGFQRGYDDGYWNRSQYGTFYNGNASILGNIVAGILGLTMIR
jgi:hypothetical protein